MILIQAQITEMQSAWYRVDCPNPNWTAFLQFLDHNAAGLWVLCFVLLVAPLAFLLIRKAIALEYLKESKTPPAETQRLFMVKKGNEVVFSHVAYDVDVDRTGENGSVYFNFLGPAIDEDHDARVSFAIYPVTGTELTVESKAIEEQS